ncbi:Uncharacterised protein [Vibrio cholerae]|nr:Uncharacterised protein [Vibrio cholerae]CSB18702.1 Uncharacterised protein [Vibrio cholerae]CSI86086.1 Uncharacterised protein [Vibrio cholerae]
MVVRYATGADKGSLRLFDKGGFQAFGARQSLYLSRRVADRTLQQCVGQRVATLQVPIANSHRQEGEGQAGDVLVPKPLAPVELKCA